MNENNKNNENESSKTSRLLGSRHLGKLKDGFSSFKNAYSEEKERLKELRKNDSENSTSSIDLSSVVDSVKNVAERSMDEVKSVAGKSLNGVKSVAEKSMDSVKKAAEKSMEWAQDGAKVGKSYIEGTKEHLDGAKESFENWREESWPEYQKKIDSTVETEKQRLKVITAKLKRTVSGGKEEEIPSKNTFQGVLYWIERVQGQGTIIKRTPLYEEMESVKPYIQWLILSDYKPNEKILEGICTTLEKYDHLVNEELPTKQVLKILRQIEGSIPDYIQAIKTMYDKAVADELSDADVHVKTVKMQLEMDGLIKDELLDEKSEEEIGTRKPRRGRKAPLFTHSTGENKK